MEEYISANLITMHDLSKLIKSSSYALSKLENVAINDMIQGIVTFQDEMPPKGKTHAIIDWLYCVGFIQCFKHVVYPQLY